MATTQKTGVKVFPRDLFVLWKNTNKEGKVYLSGKTEDGRRLLVDIFSKKENPKSPDLKIYLRKEDGSKGKIYASVWSNVSKSGNKYFSGSLEEGKKKFKGFSNKIKLEGCPDYRFYLDEELENPTGFVQEKPLEYSDNDLPF